MASNLFYTLPDTLRRNFSAKRGSFCYLYFIPIEWVNFQPTADFTGIASEDFDITGGAYWLTAKPVKAKRNYREEQKSSDGGDYMEITVTAQLPGEDTATHLALDVLKYSRFIMIVAFPSGASKMLGTKENPVTLSHTSDSGDNSNDSFNTLLKFSWINEDKPLLYTGIIDPVKI